MANIRKIVNSTGSERNSRMNGIIVSTGSANSARGSTPTYTNDTSKDITSRTIKTPDELAILLWEPELEEQILELDACDWKTLNHMLQNLKVENKNAINLRTIKVNEDLFGQFKGDSLLNKISNFKCENIEKKAVLDLGDLGGKDHLGKFSLLNVGDILGELNLPLNCESFECKDIKINKMKFPEGIISFKSGMISWAIILDLSRCKEPLEFKAGNVLTTVCFPRNVKTFECEDIGDAQHKGSFNLGANCNCGKITFKNIVNGTLIAPPDIKSFQCENIGHLSWLNLKQCAQLTEIKVGIVAGTLILPSNITIDKGRGIDKSVSFNLAELTSFECSIGIASEGKLDLRQCTRLKKLKLGLIEGEIIFPSSLESFECSLIDVKKILELPPNIQKFECRNIYSGAKLDASACRLLTPQTLTWEFLEGELILSEKYHLASFKNFKYKVRWLKAENK